MQVQRFGHPACCVKCKRIVKRKNNQYAKRKILCDIQHIPQDLVRRDKEYAHDVFANLKHLFAMYFNLVDVNKTRGKNGHK